MAHRIGSSLFVTTTTKSSTTFRTTKYYYAVAGGTTIAAFAGAAWYTKIYCDNEFGGTEGLIRSIQFYKFAIPKYFLYRYYLWKGGSDDATLWNNLHTETSYGALQLIYQLEGFYIKCGQIIAANVGNGFPRIWQDTMSILQDQCPPKDYESIIKPILQKEFATNDLNTIFEYIDPIPIGSASIGQVHRAILKVTGEHVVIKICYPNVERLLRNDVRTVKFFAQLVQPVYVPIIEEIEIQFQTEFDYIQEGRNLETIYNNLNKAGLLAGNNDNNSRTSTNKLCILPKPYLQYCTKHVLVMEELYGNKLIDELRNDITKMAQHSHQSVIEFLEIQRQREEQCKIQGYEYTGPTTDEYNRMIQLLLYRHRVENTIIAFYNYTIGWIYPQSRKNYKTNDDIPTNHSKLIDDLIYIHGHQVLVDGCFNSDPHPGNILLCRNNNNNYYTTTKPSQLLLGLIDYGQVKTISKHDRHAFAKLILALAADDKERIVQTMIESGFQSKYMNTDCIYLYAKIFFDQDNTFLLQGKHIMLFLEEIQIIDPIIQLPIDFIAIGRTSVLLRGLAHALHQPRSVATIWKPIAERILSEDI